MVMKAILMLNIKILMEDKDLIGQNLKVLLKIFIIVMKNLIQMQLENISKVTCAKSHVKHVKGLA